MKIIFSESFSKDASRECNIELFSYDLGDYYQEVSDLNELLEDTYRKNDPNLISENDLSTVWDTESRDVQLSFSPGIIYNNPKIVYVYYRNFKIPERILGFILIIQKDGIPTIDLEEIELDIERTLIDLSLSKFSCELINTGLTQDSIFLEGRTLVTADNIYYKTGEHIVTKESYYKKLGTEKRNLLNNNGQVPHLSSTGENYIPIGENRELVSIEVSIKGSVYNEETSEILNPQGGLLELVGKCNWKDGTSTLIESEPCIEIVYEEYDKEGWIIKDSVLNNFLRYTENNGTSPRLQTVHYRLDGVVSNSIDLVQNVSKNNWQVISNTPFVDSSFQIYLFDSIGNPLMFKIVTEDTLNVYPVYQDRNNFSISVIDKGGYKLIEMTPNEDCPEKEVNSYKVESVESGYSQLINCSRGSKSEESDLWMSNGVGSEEKITSIMIPSERSFDTYFIEDKLNTDGQFVWRSYHDNDSISSTPILDTLYSDSKSPVSIYVNEVPSIEPVFVGTVYFVKVPVEDKSVDLDLYYILEHPRLSIPVYIEKQDIQVISLSRLEIFDFNPEILNVKSNCITKIKTTGTNFLIVNNEGELVTEMDIIDFDNDYGVRVMVVPHKLEYSDQEYELGQIELIPVRPTGEEDYSSLKTVSVVLVNRETIGVNEDGDIVNELDLRLEKINPTERNLFILVGGKTTNIIYSTNRSCHWETWEYGEQFEETIVRDNNFRYQHHKISCKSLRLDNQYYPTKLVGTLKLIMTNTPNYLIYDVYYKKQTPYLDSEVGRESEIYLDKTGGTVYNLLLHSNYSLDYAQDVIKEYLRFDLEDVNTLLVVSTLKNLLNRETFIVDGTSILKDRLVVQLVNEGSDVDGFYQFLNEAVVPNEEIPLKLSDWEKVERESQTLVRVEEVIIELEEYFGDAYWNYLIKITPLYSNTDYKIRNLGTLVVESDITNDEFIVGNLNEEYSQYLIDEIAGVARISLHLFQGSEVSDVPQIIDTTSPNVIAIGEKKMYQLYSNVPIVSVVHTGSEGNIKEVTILDNLGSVRVEYNSRLNFDEIPVYPFPLNIVNNTCKLSNEIFELTQPIKNKFELKINEYFVEKDNITQLGFDTGFVHTNSSGYMSLYLGKSTRNMLVYEVENNQVSLKLSLGYYDITPVNLATETEIYVGEDSLRGFLVTTDNSEQTSFIEYLKFGETYNNITLYFPQNESITTIERDFEIRDDKGINSVYVRVIHKPRYIEAVSPDINDTDFVMFHSSGYCSQLGVSDFGSLGHNFETNVSVSNVEIRLESEGENVSIISADINNLGFSTINPEYSIFDITNLRIPQNYSDSVKEGNISLYYISADGDEEMLLWKRNFRQGFIYTNLIDLGGKIFSRLLGDIIEMPGQGGFYELPSETSGTKEDSPDRIVFPVRLSRMEVIDKNGTLKESVPEDSRISIVKSDWIWLNGTNEEGVVTLFSEYGTALSVKDSHIAKAPFIEHQYEVRDTFIKQRCQLRVTTTIMTEYLDIENLISREDVFVFSLVKKEGK